MTAKPTNGTWGWVLGEEKTDGKRKARALLIGFADTVKTLFDESDYETLDSLLSVLEDNLGITRELKSLIEKGATPKDITRRFGGPADEA